MVRLSVRFRRSISLLLIVIFLLPKIFCSNSYAENDDSNTLELEEENKKWLQILSLSLEANNLADTEELKNSPERAWIMSKLSRIDEPGKLIVKDLEKPTTWKELIDLLPVEGDDNFNKASKYNGNYLDRKLLSFYMEIIVDFQNTSDMDKMSKVKEVSFAFYGLKNLRSTVLLYSESKHLSVSPTIIDNISFDFESIISYLHSKGYDFDKTFGYKGDPNADGLDPFYFNGNFTRIYLELIAATSCYDPLNSNVGDVINSSVVSPEAKILYEKYGKLRLPLIRKKKVNKTLEAGDFFSLSDLKSLLKHRNQGINLYVPNQDLTQLDISTDLSFKFSDRPVYIFEELLAEFIVDNGVTEKEARGVLNYSILNNFMLDATSSDVESEDLPLYVDFLGNIVTGDNIVIYPAINNYTGLKDEASPILSSKAFLNYYPTSTSIYTEKKGKVLFGDHAKYPGRYASYYLSHINPSGLYKVFKTVNPFSKVFTDLRLEYKLIPDVDRSLMPSGDTSKRVEFLEDISNGMGFYSDATKVYGLKSLEVSNGETSFYISHMPGSVGNDFLARNSLYFLLGKEGGSDSFPFNDLFFKDLLNPILSYGVEDISVFVIKDLQDSIQEESYFEKKLRQFSSWSFSYTLGFGNILGAKNNFTSFFYNISIFILSYSIKYIAVVAICFLCIKQVAHRRRFDILILKLIIVLGISSVILSDISGLSSSAYNSVAKLILGSEVDDLVLSEVSSVPIKHKNMLYDSNPGSFTLYKKEIGEIEDLKTANGFLNRSVEDSKLLLDLSETFSWGDEVRASIKNVYKNSRFTAYEENSTLQYAYQYTGDGLDYYTPYNIILTQLLEKYNEELMLIKPQSRTITDSNVTYHINLVNTLSASRNFIDSEDFLDLTKVLFVPSQIYDDTEVVNLKSSLWYRTYHFNEVSTEEIKSLNEFILKDFKDNRLYYSIIPDERLIPFLAMKYSMKLNGYCSKIGYMVYPQSFNIDDFTVSNLLRLIVLPKQNIYYSNNRDIPKIVMSRYGIIAYIALAWSCIFLAIGTWFLNLYILTLCVKGGALTIYHIFADSWEFFIDGYARLQKVTLIILVVRLAIIRGLIHFGFNVTYKLCLFLILNYFIMVYMKFINDTLKKDSRNMMSAFMPWNVLKNFGSNMADARVLWDRNLQRTKEGAGRLMEPERYSTYIENNRRLLYERTREPFIATSRHISERRSQDPSITDNSREGDS